MSRGRSRNLGQETTRRDVYERVGAGAVMLGAVMLVSRTEIAGGEVSRAIVLVYDVSSVGSCGGSCCVEDYGVEGYSVG